MRLQAHNSSVIGVLHVCAANFKGTTKEPYMFRMHLLLRSSMPVMCKRVGATLAYGAAQNSWRLLA
jgi:hypothetical protein